MSASTELLLGGVSVSISRKALFQSCETFSNDPALLASPYSVRSPVTLSGLTTFLDAVNSQDVTITAANAPALSLLCDEFGFTSLQTRLSEFRETSTAPEVQISLLKDHIATQDERIAILERSNAVLNAEFVVLQRKLSDLSTSAEVHSRLTRLEDLVAALDESLGEMKTADDQLFQAPPNDDEPPPSIFQAEELPPEPPTVRLDSLIAPAFPSFFNETVKFTLIYRGSRDGFRAGDFHAKCDGIENTLTIIQTTHGFVFGGFTPLKWSSGWTRTSKADTTGRSFLFTVKSPHPIGPKSFPLKPNGDKIGIYCDSGRGPCFGYGCDLSVSNDCSSNEKSYTTKFGTSYANTTKIPSDRVFTGTRTFVVKEMEVFVVDFE
jgi:hypothetical protein